jgi:very-short-patch-repair endonuclease
MITPEIIKETARKLRQNMTEAEKILWEKIRAKRLWIKFYRQRPVMVMIENSMQDRYIIPDFYSPDNKIIIEIDWSIHDVEKIYLLDIKKEKLLKNKWYKVIRFRNEEIFENLKGVLEVIMRECWK